MRVASGALAHRYARALVEVVAGAGADGAALGTELREAGRILLGEPELSRLLLTPALALEQKRKLLGGLWARTKPQPFTERLADLLVARDRLALLPAIADAFAALWNERRGVLTAEAVSAVALSPAQNDALKAALQQVSGFAVEIGARVDPEVLGGLLVRVGGKTYDGTVRGRLQALRAHLAE